MENKVIKLPVKGVNVEFFRKLTPDLAYILGVWAAYGKVKRCYTSDKRYYKNELRLFNKALLDYVVEKIGYKNKIQENLVTSKNDGTIKTLYSISFINQEVSEFIIGYGITPDNDLKFFSEVLVSRNTRALKDIDVFSPNWDLLPAFFLGYIHAGKAFIVNEVNEFVDEYEVREAIDDNEEDMEEIGDLIILGYHSWELAHGFKNALTCAFTDGVTVEKRPYGFPYEVSFRDCGEAFFSWMDSLPGYINGLGDIRVAERAI